MLCMRAICDPERGPSKMSKRSRTKKPYWEMTLAELRAATKEFDRPIPLSKTKPLTSAERATFERMQRSPSVSIFITRDASGVWVRLDPEILRRTTRYAAKNRLSLAQVINRSLRGLLATVD